MIASKNSEAAEKSGDSGFNLALNIGNMADDAHKKKLEEIDRKVFETETYEKTQMIKQTQKFSCLVFLAILCYVFSFILEDRSADMIGMTKALNPYFFELEPLEIKFYHPEYSLLGDCKDGFLYSIKTLLIFLLDKEEVSPMTSQKPKYLSHNEESLKNVSLVHWNFVSNNIKFMGARLSTTFEGDPDEKPLAENIHFFRSNIKSDEALAEIKSVFVDTINFNFTAPFFQNNNKAKSMIDCELELLFYNHITETGGYYKMKYHQSEITGFLKTMEPFLFMPKFNDYQTEYLAPMVIVWTLRVLYNIYFVYYALTGLYQFVTSLIMSFQEKMIYISPDNLLQVVFIILNLAYLIGYLEAFFRKELYRGDPIVDQTEFERWVRLGYKQKRLFLFEGLIVIMLILQMLKMIKAAFFNSLNILFASFSVTASMLTSFLGLFIMMIVLSTVITILIVGKFIVDFGDPYSTLEQIILSMFQNTSHDEHALLSYLWKDTIIPSLYFYFLFLVFNTVLLHFFIAIVLTSYSELRKKYQLAIETQARFETLEGISTKDKILSLLSFKPYDQEKHKIMNEKKLTRQSVKRKALQNYHETLSVKLYTREAHSDDDSFEEATGKERPTSPELPPKKKKMTSEMIKPALVNGPASGQVSPQKKVLRTKTVDQAIKELKKENKKKEDILNIKKWAQPQDMESLAGAHGEESFVSTKYSMKKILKGNLNLLGFGGNSDSIISRDKFIAKMITYRKAILEDKEIQLKGLLFKMTSTNLQSSLNFCLYLVFCLFFYVLVTANLKMHDYSAMNKTYNNHKNSFTLNRTIYKGTFNYNNSDTLYLVYLWQLHDLAQFKPSDNKIHKNISDYNFQFTNMDVFFVYQKKNINETVWVNLANFQLSQTFTEEGFEKSIFTLFKSPRHTEVCFPAEEKLTETSSMDLNRTIPIPFNRKLQGLPIAVFHSLKGGPNGDDQPYFNEEDEIPFYTPETFKELGTDNGPESIYDIDLKRTDYFTLMFNVNEEMISLFEIVTTMKITGKVDKKVIVHLVFFSIYKNRSWIVLIIEIIYYISLLQRIFANYSIFKLYWKDVDNWKYQSIDPSLKGEDLFSQILNKSIYKMENLSELFSALFSRIWLKISHFFHTIWLILVRRPLKIFQMISTILSITGVVLWIIYLSIVIGSHSNMEYIASDLTPTQEMELVLLMRKASLMLDSYKLLQSINSLFLVLGILDYMHFNPRFSQVVSTLTLAKKEILAYLFIFLTITMGFATAGFLLFGDRVDEFSTFNRAAMKVIFMMNGSIPYKQMNEVYPLVAPLYIFCLLIPAYTMFLKLIIVVMASIYREYMAMCKETTVNIWVSGVDSAGQILASYVLQLENIRNKPSEYRLRFAQHKYERIAKKREMLKRGGFRKVSDKKRKRNLTITKN